LFSGSGRFPFSKLLPLSVWFMQFNKNLDDKEVTIPQLIDHKYCGKVVSEFF
jgi:hypothetical protein